MCGLMYFQLTLAWDKARCYLRSCSLSTSMILVNYVLRSPAVILFCMQMTLISPSVTKLESLLHCCEHELAWLDVTINFRKSCCLRIGPRCDIECCAITSLSGVNLSWVTELRYLGVYIVKWRILKCLLDAAERGFYCATISWWIKVSHMHAHKKVDKYSIQVSHSKFDWLIEQYQSTEGTHRLHN